MRRPLKPVSDEEGRRLAGLYRVVWAPGTAQHLMPLGSTPAEVMAGQKPGLPARSDSMETKPGYKTTEFWLTLVFGIGVACLGFLSENTEAFSALPGVWGMLAALALKVAVVPALAWMTVKYNEYRAKLKGQPAPPPAP